MNERQLILKPSHIVRRILADLFSDAADLLLTRASTAVILVGRRLH